MGLNRPHKPSACSICPRGVLSDSFASPGHDGHPAALDGHFTGHSPDGSYCQKTNISVPDGEMIQGIFRIRLTLGWRVGGYGNFARNMIPEEKWINIYSYSKHYGQLVAYPGSEERTGVNIKIAAMISFLPKLRSCCNLPDLSVKYTIGMVFWKLIILIYLQCYKKNICIHFSNIK